MIRAIVVDDVATVRSAVRKLLTEHGEVEIVGEGTNGEEAVALTTRLHPDIVLMDVDMPSMDGIEATREIMACCATPILIITSSAIYDERHLPFSAIEAGALDVFPKPSVGAGETWDAAATRLSQAVRMLARVPVVSRKPRMHVSRILTEARPPTPGWLPAVIVVGASTGGPSIIRSILEPLPEDYPVPVALVQHIGDEFVPGFAEWLDHAVRPRVSLAQDGRPLAPGTVSIAPGDVHIRIDDGPTIRFDHGPRLHHCRPAVDVLFQSAAHACRADVVAILLTGMGRDGADGMRAVRTAGGITLAQDRESSTVYGMPGAAIELGAVQYVKTPEEIGRWLTRLSLTGMAGRR